MLMTASAALLSSLVDQSRELEASILSGEHEITPGKKAYYLSPYGDDTLDGLTPDTAWRSLDAFPANTPEPGSEVLLERGGIWRGSFRAYPNVTYSAYGDGDKPRIYGSPFDGKDKTWTEVAPDVYRLEEKLNEDCGCIVMDGGAFHTVKTVLNYAGKVPVNNITGEAFGGFADLKEDLTFWHDLGGAFTQNPDGGYIYLCSKEGNPSERFTEIEFLPRRNVISITGDGVTIDNLTIMYGGAHGIGSGSVKDLTVTNCVLGWIGGSLQYYRDGKPVRFGNGVEIYGSCDNYRIEGCHVYQIYDAGITHQLSAGQNNDCLMKHVHYIGNLIEYCSYSIEYFLGKASDENAVREMSDIEIKGNIMRYAGYGWGAQRPDKTSPAHIKGWDSYNKLTGAFTVEDNIMESSRYMLLHCGAEDIGWLPVFRANTFLQYEGGEFGRFGKKPTELMLYTHDNTLREEFAGNEFYVINTD